ncbi:hypothetical protein [Citrobacter koseri]|uniref:hypothetical protein n=1 Tax=Citrobacter koseri TaxID=545 RepID=UPI001F3FDE1A|nr:hypothetical protein [Citrobacter koseri]
MSKPTYEELEAKVKQLEADNEKAMSVLKEANDAVLLAKSKFEALAAENAAAKHAVQAFCDVVGANTDAICEVVGQEGVKAILTAMSATGNMPATDAFLAEVRASELDSLAGVAETMLVKFSNQQCSSDMHEVVGWKMVLQQASNRASMLRKGAAQ